MTVFACEGPHSVFCYGTPEEMLHVLSDSLCSLGNNNMHVLGQTLLVLNPLNAEECAKRGWAKQDVRRYLWEHARRALADVRACGVVHEQFRRMEPDAGRYPLRYDLDNPTTRLPVTPIPEDIHIVVAGGRSYFAAVLPGWGGFGGFADNIAVSDAELDAEMQKIIASLGGQAKFEEQLKIAGQMLDEARSMQRMQMLYLKMRDRVVGNLQTAEQVHARHILVDSQATAQALLAQIQAGADFGQIAQQSSQDTLTRANGGDLGWFARGVLPAKEVEDVAFALQPGQVSGVVQSAFGYHIVQVLERDSARKLEGEMFVEVQMRAMGEWLDSLRAQAKVQRLAGQ